jgi:hypothetical protein
MEGQTVMDKDELRRSLEQQVQDHLSQLTDRLISELRPIVTKTQPQDTYLLDFEVHADGFGDSFPVYWDPFDAELTQLPGRTDLLADIPYTIPPEIIDSEEYDDMGIDAWNIAFRMLAPWFAECWHAAGGLDCAYPAYICQHDDVESFDLKQRTWISDDEKWPPE